MKICIITPYPPQRGGVASYVNELVERLVKKHKLTILTYYRYFREQKRNIRFVEIHLPSIPFIRGLLFLLRSLNFLKTHGRSFDIIHAHYLHPCGTAAILYKLFFNKTAKVVITLHGSDIDKLLKNKLVRKPFLILLHHANAVCTVSNYLAEKLKDYGFNKKIFITPSGIPKIRFKKAKVIKLTRKKGEIIIGYFGALETHKGFDNLLKCFAKISKKIKNCRLVVAGRGKFARPVKKLAKNTTRITYLGELTREEVFVAMQKCDIIVVPSRREGFGLSALEACTLGKACIARDVGGIKEILPVIARNKNFCKLLERALISVEFRKKLEKTCSRAAKKFSWEKTVRKIEKIYCTL